MALSIKNETDLTSTVTDSVWMTELSSTTLTRITAVPKFRLVTTFPVLVTVIKSEESGVRFDAVSDNGMQASTTTRPNRFDTNLLKAEKKNGNESMSIELVQSGYTVLRTMCGT